MYDEKSIWMSSKNSYLFHSAICNPEWWWEKTLIYSLTLTQCVFWAGVYSLSLIRISIQDCVSIGHITPLCAFLCFLNCGCWFCLLRNLFFKFKKLYIFKFQTYIKDARIVQRIPVNILHPHSLLLPCLFITPLCAPHLSMNNFFLNRLKETWGCDSPLLLNSSVCFA